MQRFIRLSSVIEFSPVFFFSTLADCFLSLISAKYPFLALGHESSYKNSL
jgi:hypothetical protein